MFCKHLKCQANECTNIIITIHNNLLQIKPPIIFIWFVLTTQYCYSMLNVFLSYVSCLVKLTGLFLLDLVAYRRCEADTTPWLPSQVVHQDYSVRIRNTASQRTQYPDASNCFPLKSSISLPFNFPMTIFFQPGVIG